MKSPGHCLESRLPVRPGSAMVPHLITALTGPINELEQRILESMPAIERWFRLEWMEHTPPFYTSVDLRNAGFKLAPVDTNLFPGGFNNLTPEMLPLAVQAAMAAIEKICPEAKNLLLIPENHTRNSFYLANVAQLMRDLPPGRAERAPRHARPRRSRRPTEVAAARRQRAHASSRWCATAAALGLKDFDPVHDPAQQRPVGRHPAACSRTCTSSTCCRRCTPAGRCAARANHFHAYEEVAKKFAQAARHGPVADQPDVRARAARSTSATAPGIECLTSNAERCSARSAASTRNTASRRSRS